MTNVVKLRKGLDINLKGRATKTKFPLNPSDEYALVPDDFVGVTPKVVVREGDMVKAGDALFVNKNCPEVKFSSPVSGIVTAVLRGERRKVLCVKVKADKEMVFADFGKQDVEKLSGEEVKGHLLQAGLFGYINQLPYAVSTTPDTKPKSIFVSALRDMPLAGDFEYELTGNEHDFQTGLTALSKVAKVYLGIGKGQRAEALTQAKNAEVTVFDGPCPAGNVGVQVRNLSVLFFNFDIFLFQFGFQGLYLLFFFFHLAFQLVDGCLQFVGIDRAGLQLLLQADNALPVQLHGTLDERNVLHDVFLGHFF